MKYEVIDTQIAPEGRLEVLSKAEVAKLRDTSQGGLYNIFRNCSLAVLNCGNAMDDGKELLERFKDFDISILQRERGIKLDIKGAPVSAFVDGQMIKGIHEHLFAVLRDVIFVSNEIQHDPKFDLESSEGTTDAVFHILRNANMLQPQISPNLVVCWGGHSISRVEYEYTKKVGYQLGLRAMDICTGCGPGAMKGPMKGATIGHAKQRITGGRYLGVTEPGIIAAEAPNPIVNDLVILPDIEKRLEAFVRLGHGIVVFPGGAGTAEEILYILGILLHPENAEIPFPLIFTGPHSAAAYFEQIDRFIGDTLGPEARQRYQVIIDDPAAVAREMLAGVKQVREYRKDKADAYYFNWRLKIDREFQRPFEPTHDNIRNLKLHRQQESHLLAANLRRAFSGVVAGNVKDQGIRAIEEHGPFEIHGDAGIMAAMDALLASFVEHHRMKLPGKNTRPVTASSNKRQADMTPRAILVDLFQAAVAAAQPALRVPQALSQVLPPPRGRSIVIGAGKAAAHMAAALESFWPAPLEGVVVTRYGHAAPCRQIRILEAGHPMPDQNSLAAAQAMLRQVTGLTKDDLVISLISGGGSALLAAPVAGISLADKQQVTQAMFQAGATIRELNQVRQALSMIKGGRLAIAAWPARVLTLVISDVPGDDPAFVASGPTVAPPADQEPPLEILARLGVRLPRHVIAVLAHPAMCAPQDFSHCRTELIATAMQSLEAAARRARELGLAPLILSDCIEAEAREAALVHAAIAQSVRRHHAPLAPPAVLLSGGECRVSLGSGPAGKGGRNTEFLLALGLALRPQEQICALACDTDGIDGSEENAGAVWLPDSMERARKLALDLPLHLAQHDSHAGFAALGDLVMTGPTHTNVNDFRAILIN